MQTRKLTSAALLIAIGTLSAHLIYIPAGVSKCFPVQHAINVMGAVLLGPDYAVAIGFIIACLRNVLGTGSLLAFPGSMIGAALAGLAYSRYKTLTAANGWRNIRYRHHRWFRRLDYGHTAFRQQCCSLVLHPAVFSKHHRRQYYCLPVAQDRFFQTAQ